MAKPVAISAKSISAAAKTSVAKAIVRHKAAFPKPDYRLGFIPPYWWCGFIIDHPEGPFTLADAQRLAADTHSGIAAEIPSVKGAIPGAIFGGGHIICGFLPPPDINLLEE
jgi:hypothetical protein